MRSPNDLLARIGAELWAGQPVTMQWDELRPYFAGANDPARYKHMTAWLISKDIAFSTTPNISLAPNGDLNPIEVRLSALAHP